MTIELEAVSDGAMSEDIVWVRPAGGGRFPQLVSGQEIIVRLDGDPSRCLGSVIDAADTTRVLIMLDRVALTAQVELVDDEPRSTTTPPLIDPRTTG